MKDEDLEKIMKKKQLPKDLEIDINKVFEPIKDKMEKKVERLKKY